MGEEAGGGDVKQGRVRMLWLTGAWLHGVARPTPTLSGRSLGRRQQRTL